MSFPNLSAKLLQYPTKVAVEIWKGFQTMASESKNSRLIRKIGTHNGIFHCDEALACYMLKQLPEYKDAEIVRSRDSSVLDLCDVVVDVGATYNPKLNRYDHHQKGFNETLSTVRPDLARNKHIKLSSAGLVYAHFGMEVLSEVLCKHKIDATSECLRGIYLAVYESFVEELDAIDNGIPMYNEGQPKYRISTHLSARVNKINPKWNSPNKNSTDDLFCQAMALTGSEFTEKVVEAASVWWPAREIVKKSVLERKKLHESGEIIELAETCPWKDHLFSIEDELDLCGQIKFVIFHQDSWRVQAIPLQPDSFICRIFLSENWRGIRDEELSQVSGIKGSIFCHATGFIGGNQTKEGALKMAIESIKAANIK